MLTVLQPTLNLCLLYIYSSVTCSTLAGYAQNHRTIYSPFRPEVLGEASSSDPVALWKATKADPWDGRISREEQFVQKLKAVGADSEITDLDPILDDMRVIKSAREIAVIREATRIAGLGIMEAMRDARPGMKEYELQADAEFVFKKFGAYGPSYFALIATGRNTFYSHYHRNTATLEDGDLVQFDYAPDYKYLPVRRHACVSGQRTFTPRQREFYSDLSGAVSGADVVASGCTRRRTRSSRRR